VNGIQNARKSFGWGVALSGIVALSIILAAHGLFQTSCAADRPGLLQPGSKSGL
jgi:hypothetical protein